MPFGKAASEYDRNLLAFSMLDKWFCFVNVDVPDNKIRELVRQSYDIVVASLPKKQREELGET